MKSIAVYLGSAPACKDIYKELAYQLGRRLAESGFRLIYGGAAVGTMGTLADGALEAGGEVVGVFPRGFCGTQEVRESGVEVVRKGLTEFIETADFAERKRVMEDLSDACIIMPGSFGTLDELFTYACNRAIGKHKKPIYLLNHEGYYNPLKQLLGNMQAAGFHKPVMTGALTFCDTLEDLMTFLLPTHLRAPVSV